ncbi:AAA family ATPase [Microlunatus panaciterrae]|uniref:ATPase n=1 Tax=Microlunatus panaciterrae TaxID=400768 RepID=A0ABS2RII8_9ACTN|nr:AAA family ATPase [Microlunatus panaciterrae]MBM7798031.1 putative ATPase [Microlunatus panaciterrae]
MLTTIAVTNYRSLRDLRVPLGPLNVVTGANGTGKSSLYRALHLLADCAQGRVIGSLAREGGLESVLWAGPESISGAMRRGEQPVQGTVRSGPITLQLGFSSDQFGYLVDLGIPQRSDRSAFNQDPEIKREVVWDGPVMRPSGVLVQRTRQAAQLRGPEGGWEQLATGLPTYHSVLAEFADPQRAPELWTLRETVRSWRFYDSFRTDVDAPARQPQVGTRTLVLDHDGSDLAAALQTIIEVGNADALQRAVDDAFPGAQLSVSQSAGRFDVAFQQPGLLRPLMGAELSDGTLRYLLLVAALLTPRPPELMVLNEPETSLHPELLAPLGRLISQASRRSQVIVVSHAAALIAELRKGTDSRVLELVKDLGETRIADLGRLDGPAWNWGRR